MKNKNGFVLSTYVYILLVFFLLLLGTMLAVLNNTKILSNKLKDNFSSNSALIDKEFRFVLLGDKEIFIRLGDEYVEPGFKILSFRNVDLSDNVKIESNLVVTDIGVYTIDYIATYNGVTKTLTRTVHVLDNTATKYVEALYQYKNDDNGLIRDDTDDKNIRYSGSNDQVKNYVEFGNDGELWRIVGIFNINNGISYDKRIKIVRESSIGEYSWDSSDSSIYEGNGINQWGESTYIENGNTYIGADLMRELNTTYLNQETGYCCNKQGEGKCELIKCDFTSSSSTKGISGYYRNYIDEVYWNTGIIKASDYLSVSDSYNFERGDASNNEKDIVNKTDSWKGKVGLLYPSDYSYASSDATCNTNIKDDSCKINNWLYKNKQYYLLSPIAYIDTYISSHEIMIVHEEGKTTFGLLTGSFVYPSVYLNNNIKIASGDGTANNPYKLSL